MDLLYVTESVPNRDPVHGDGSSLIPFEVIRRLPREVTVRLLTFDDGPEVPASIRRRCVETVTLPRRHASGEKWRSLLSTRSTGTRQRTSPQARAAVCSMSSEADVTLVHGPHAAALTHSTSGPVVLQVVDPWSRRLTMEAELVSGWRRGYRLLKARRALVPEQRLPAHVRLLTVGREDARRWSEQLGRPVTAIPNGVETRGSSPGRVPGPPLVCFVGSLDYPPNVESASALVTDVAPLVWAKLPDVHFLIAGRRPVPAVLALAGHQVEVLGDVSSVTDVFERADVAAFPDRHGLGVRNSVTEALAAGLTVVATPVAAREQAADPQLLVAESAPAIAELLCAALRRPTREHPETAKASPRRTWQDVAREYLSECRLAMATEARR